MGIYYPSLKIVKRDGPNVQERKGYLYHGLGYNLVVEWEGI